MESPGFALERRGLKGRVDWRGGNQSHRFLLTSAMIAVASFSTRGVITSSPSAVAFASRVVLSTGAVLPAAFMWYSSTMSLLALTPLERVAACDAAAGAVGAASCSPLLFVLLTIGI